MMSLATTPSLHMSVDGLYRSGTDEESTRGAGGKHPSRARIRKSLSQQGPSSSCSIPSRYQTFFYSTTESRGFNSQASRFADHLNANDNPGPGSYPTKSAALKSESYSHSKQGTGGFASKTRRFPRQRRQELGPGSYSPLPQDNKHDFNRASTSSNFQAPIAVKPDHALSSSQTISAAPAPNTYNLSGVHTGKNSLITAEAAFKSRSRREALPPPSNPAPGQYAVSDGLLHPTPSPHHSVFNSQSKREGVVTQTTLGPGPADYTPFAPVIEEPNELKQLPYYKQKHYLCISAPAMPLPPLPPPPGPGHYETQGNLVPSSDKKLMPGAVFKSTVPRWSGPSSEAPTATTTSRYMAPGPGSYDPKYSRKQSYLYNVQRKWI